MKLSKLSTATEKERNDSEVDAMKLEEVEGRPDLELTLMISGGRWWIWWRILKRRFSLEMWYYRLLMVLASKMKNAEIAVDALSICMSINGLELSIPMAFFVGAGVRVANELGAGNGKAARFATIISVGTSTFIGLIIWALILCFSYKIGLMFTSSPEVLKAVDHLSVLLAFTVLLNSVQPVLSGVAVGSGWQGLVAYVNLGSYYLIGVPAGLVLGWVFNLQVLGLWAGMIGGTAVQTLILTFLTIRCDWVKEETKAAARINKWTTANTQSEDF